MTANERTVWTKRRVRSRLTWGSLSVEMAIVAPILILLLFGTMEMGLLFRDSLVLNSACREAARVAALGGRTADVTARAQAAATTLVASNVTVTQQYRTYSAGTWGSWTNLANTGDGTANNASSGAQIRITLTYPHELCTGSLFASLANPGTSTVTVRGNMVMMRE